MFEWMTDVEYLKLKSVPSTCNLSDPNYVTSRKHRHTGFDDSDPRFLY